MCPTNLTNTEIYIHDLSHDGRGVGRYEAEPRRSDSRGTKTPKGKACFVEGALPGETVLWRRLNSKRSFDEGRLEQVLIESEERVEPRCTYYSECGGCQLQHLESRAQLLWKERQLRMMLEKAGIVSDAWMPALATKTWGYRRRCRLAVVFGRKGRISVGFRKKASRDIVDIDCCVTLDEQLNQLLPKLKDLARDLRPFGLTEFELTAADSGQLAICCSLTKTLDFSTLASFAKFDKNTFFWQKLPGQEPVAQIDSGSLEINLTETVQMSFLPGQFVQVNGTMNQAMIDRALKLSGADKQTRVLDLFCGAGNFALAFAEKVESVLGVEGLASLTHQADLNAQRLGYSNARFQMIDLFKPEQFVRIDTKGGVDLVILDPPRAGAASLVSWLRKLAPAKILYVSCHPATMVRDISALIPDYRLDRVFAMDMFPHTAHLESMALLTKNQVSG